MPDFCLEYARYKNEGEDVSVVVLSLPWRCIIPEIAVLCWTLARSQERNSELKYSESKIAWARP